MVMTVRQVGLPKNRSPKTHRKLNHEFQGQTKLYTLKLRKPRKPKPGIWSPQCATCDACDCVFFRNVLERVLGSFCRGYEELYAVGRGGGGGVVFSGSTGARHL